jgi:hypothetical protein
MSRAIKRRWTGRTGRKAGAVLRFFAALLLVVQIVYTPIHLYRVPHSDEAEFGAATPQTSAAAFVVDADHDGAGHHQRHSAVQHKLKVLRSQRAAPMDLMLVPVVEWVAAEKDCPEPQVFEFSGLSPPELPRCWQFLFRAALPVRAPSFLS